jgi:S1-C subfamily serine protease
MNWSGAALISAKGELVGIGSLIVNDSAGAGSQSPGNMFVPIDLLKPILDDLMTAGRRSGPARPVARAERRGNARPAHHRARVAGRAGGASGPQERRHRHRASPAKR